MTIVIRNKRKKMIVLKAVGQPVLRLLPGLNSVDVKDLKEYEEGNRAAKARFENDLEIIKGTLTSAEKAEAESAKKTNDKLNKSKV